MAPITNLQDWRTIADFNVPGAPGDEWTAVSHVSHAIRGFNLAVECRERLRGAVTHAARNVIARADPAAPHPTISIRVLAMTCGQADPTQADYAPAGQAGGGDCPRHGWGFFLVQKVAEAGRTDVDRRNSTIAVYLYPE